MPCKASLSTLHGISIPQADGKVVHDFTHLVPDGRKPSRISPARLFSQLPYAISIPPANRKVVHDFTHLPKRSVVRWFTAQFFLL